MRDVVVVCDMYIVHDVCTVCNVCDMCTVCLAYAVFVLRLLCW